MIKLQIRNIDLSGFLIFFSTENCVCFLVDGAMRQVFKPNVIVYSIWERAIIL